MKYPVDVPRWIFFCIAGISAFLVFLIIGFLLYTASPVLKTSGIGFITGSVWDYDTHQYGIWVYLVDTVILTALALVIAVPSGLLTAMFLAEWAPPWLEKILRPLVELLVGIPSVVYGLFGILILSNFFIDYLDPFIVHFFGFIPIFRSIHGGSHMSLLLTATILAVMVLPTIVALSQDAMREVPREYREASIALGATRWETLRYVVIPSAFPGIVTSVILAMMRAMGETMAVVMLLGNSPVISSSVFDMGYTMTGKILNDILWNINDPEARAAIFGIAVVLFAMEIIAVAGVRLLCSFAYRGSRP